MLLKTTEIFTPNKNKLKRHIQRLIRQSYWQYIEDVVTTKNTYNIGSNYNTVKRFGTRGQT